MRKEQQQQFFNRLAIASGFSDPVTAQRVYFGLVELVREGLRERRVCELPELGKFHSENGPLRFKSNHNLKWYALTVRKIME